MAGGIILSRRLERMNKSMQDFGDTYAEIGDQQRKQKLEDEDRVAAQEERGLRMRGLKNDVGLSDISFGRAKEQEAGRVEAQGLAGELAGFGQAVPENEIDTGGLGDFQPQQSMRPVSDTSAQSLQDRIRASWMNADAKAKGETSAYTAADVQRQRAEGMESKKRESEKASLDLDKTRADIESTKAGTGEKLMDTKKTAMEMKKLQAEIDAIGKGGLDPEKAYAIEDKISSKYIAQNGGFSEMGDAIGRVRVSAKEPSGAGDMSLIYGYMKILDPKTGIKEGEVASAQDAGSIPQSILAAYNKAVSGTKLDPKVRADFVKRAEMLYSEAERGYIQSRANFQKLAASYGVNAERSTPDLRRTTAEGEAGAPAAGVAKVSTKEEWAALPPGTSYIGPDGKKATKR